MTGVVGAIVAWGGLAWRFIAFGISTVPGFIAAAPVAALGFFGERNRREQVLWTGALVAIPAIWITEWVGGHVPNGVVGTCSCPPRCSWCWPPPRCAGSAPGRSSSPS